MLFRARPRLELEPGRAPTERSGLSNEVRERLEEVRPETLGQAARVPWVTPAAVSLLLVHLKRDAAHGGEDSRRRA